MQGLPAAAVLDEEINFTSWSRRRCTERLVRGRAAGQAAAARSFLHLFHEGRIRDRKAPAVISSSSSSVMLSYAAGRVPGTRQLSDQVGQPLDAGRQLDAAADATL